MLQTWHTTKGYVAGVVAFVACPCHLPITLPLLIVLTAGTTFGTWLENNTLTIATISTVIFIGGIILAFKWIGQSKFPEDSSVSQANPEPGVSRTELPKVTLLISSACSSCREAKTIWQQARQQTDFQFEEVDIGTAKGRKLAAKYNIFSTPATIVDDRTVIRGQPKLTQALAAIYPNHKFA